MLFWKKNNETDNTGKKTLRSDEYEFCLKRIAELNSAVQSLEAKYKIVQTDLDNLRGNFNRKLKGIKEEEKKEEQIEQPQNINTDLYIPFG